MTSESSVAALYRLIHDESQDVLLVAKDLLGFFVEPSQKESDDIIFIGVPRERCNLEREFSEIELQVIDFRGEIVGSYYVGRVRLGNSRPSVHGVDFVDLVSSFYGYACHYPQAGKIWRRWASEEPIEPGEWLRYPTAYHSSWLHVVQTAWFESGRSATKYGTDEICSIDGRKISSVDGFYCALGEAINDSGGYFGSSLDGLADCLSMSREPGTPLRILWNSFPISRKILGEGFVMSVVATMQEFDVDVILR